MMFRGRRRVPALATAFAMVGLIAACGGGGDDTGAGSDGSSSGTTVAEGEPQPGGSITISPGLAPLVGLDPTQATVTGCCGGSELMLIYDTLVKYDVETASYEMGTAESLEPNADATEWTLVLKPDITFTDGNPYDADAVKLNVERHLESPRSQEYPLLTQLLDSVEVVDPLTVVFRLEQPWTNFPVTLAAGAGMIASPAAIDAAGEDFNVSPGAAGAGPFTVKEFTPNESLVLVRNDDYYGGEVYLDQITSTFIAGSDAQLQSVESGTLQGVQLSTPEDRQRAIDAGLGVLDVPYYLGNLVLMNGGSVACAGGAPAAQCAGEPDGTIVDLGSATADPRVRRAVAHAIDESVVSERVYGGTLDTYRTLFPETFRWDPGVDGPGYDPDEASELVDEAKADGWDGKIRISIGVPTPTLTTYAQVLETMLSAVGMEPSIETDVPLSAIQVDRDFDLYPQFGFGTSEDRVFEGLFSSVRNYRYGYDSEAMNQALDDLGAASTDDAKVDAYERIAEIWNEDVPAAVVGEGYRYFISDPDLHGVDVTAWQMIDLRKAWLDQ